MTSYNDGNKCSHNGNYQCHGIMCMECGEFLPNNGTKNSPEEDLKKIIFGALYMPDFQVKAHNIVMKVLYKTVLYKDTPCFYRVHENLSKIYDLLTSEDKKINLHECLEQVTEISEYIMELELKVNHYESIIKYNINNDFVNTVNKNDK